MAVPVLEIIAPRFSEGHNVFQHDDMVYGIVYAYISLLLCNERDPIRLVQGCLGYRMLVGDHREQPGHTGGTFLLALEQ